MMIYNYVTFLCMEDYFVLLNFLSIFNKYFIDPMTQSFKYSFILPDFVINIFGI